MIYHRKILNYVNSINPLIKIDKEDQSEIDCQNVLDLSTKISNNF